MATTAPSVQKNPQTAHTDSMLGPKLVRGPVMPFIDLASQRERLVGIEQAILEVVRHGAYLNGPESVRLESELAAFAGCQHAISCASGTMALDLVLRAWGIGPGDAVFIPSFTFIASASATAMLRATPFFVDVLPDTYNMDPASLRSAIATAKSMGLVPRVVMVVDLFGQTADYPTIEAIADQHGLPVLCDSAQSFGAALGNKRVGNFGHATITSFYPAKPLSCYGDGGAVFCHDDELADNIIALREYGKRQGASHFTAISGNARMDTIQAAILLEKLSIFADELEQRQSIATRYDEKLAAYRPELATPILMEHAKSSWAQYTIRLFGDGLRDRVTDSMRRAGVPWAIHYRTPPHLQPAYQDFPRAPDGLPVSEMLADQVLSLPMHPYLSDQDQDRVIKAIADGF